MGQLIMALPGTTCEYDRACLKIMSLFLKCETPMTPNPTLEVCFFIHTCMFNFCYILEIGHYSKEIKRKKENTESKEFLIIC